MELKYPGRYVILTFLDNGCYVVSEDNQYEGVLAKGHIVARCFLVSERVNYLEDGSTYNNYEVVLPYTYVSQPNIEYPIFNSKGLCKNSKYVDYIYSSYYDARKRCSELNSSLRQMHEKHYTKIALSNEKKLTKDFVSSNMYLFDQNLNVIKQCEAELATKTRFMFNRQFTLEKK